MATPNSPNEEDQNTLLDEINGIYLLCELDIYDI